MTVEDEVLLARRGFRDAQNAMIEAGLPGPLYGDRFYTASWYGTLVSDERGSFCVVNPDGPLAELVGDYVRVRYGLDRWVMAYVVGFAEIDTDLGLSRRCFASIAHLAQDEIGVSVEVVS